MEKFLKQEGIVAPLDRTDIDTDAIIPKQFLKSVQRTGFGEYLFDGWRYLNRGEPGMDCAKRPINPDFVLNKERYRDAIILLTRANFGCGSSREHAPWALIEYGFQVLIAPSFADIFYNNCFKNGLLPVTLDESVVDKLFEEVQGMSGYTLLVNLKEQTIESPISGVINFEIERSRRQALLEGIDEIGLTLKNCEKIMEFEIARRQEAPWLYKELS